MSTMGGLTKPVCAPARPQLCSKPELKENAEDSEEVKPGQ